MVVLMGYKDRKCGLEDELSRDDDDPERSRGDQGLIGLITT